MGTLTKQQTLRIYDCSQCGINYAAPQEFFDRKSAANDGWYCPNGHRQCFVKSALTQVEEQLATSRKSEQFYCEEARRERDHAERRRRSTKAALTKTRARIAQGKCIKCSASFPDIKAHMATQYPEKEE